MLWHLRRQFNLKVIGLLRRLGAITVEQTLPLLQRDLTPRSAAHRSADKELTVQVVGDPANFGGLSVVATGFTAGGGYRVELTRPDGTREEHVVGYGQVAADGGLPNLNIDPLRTGTGHADLIGMWRIKVVDEAREAKHGHGHGNTFTEGPFEMPQVDWLKGWRNRLRWALRT